MPACPRHKPSTGRDFERSVTVVRIIWQRATRQRRTTSWFIGSAAVLATVVWPLVIPAIISVSRRRVPSLPTIVPGPVVTFGVSLIVIGRAPYRDERQCEEQVFHPFLRS